MGQPARIVGALERWLGAGLLDNPGPAGNSERGRSIFRQAQGVGRRSLTNTTTGSERVVPGQPPPAPKRNPLLARLVRPAVTHWQFGLVVVAAIAVRIVVVLGYPPILWFSDSYNYIYDAVTHIPDQV